METNKWSLPLLPSFPIKILSFHLHYLSSLLHQLSPDLVKSPHSAPSRVFLYKSGVTILLLKKLMALLYTQNKKPSQSGPTLLSNLIYPLSTHPTFESKWTTCIPRVWVSLHRLCTLYLEYPHHPSQSNSNVTSSMKPSPRYKGDVTTACVHTQHFHTFLFSHYLQ